MRHVVTIHDLAPSTYDPRNELKSSEVCFIMNSSKT